MAGHRHITSIEGRAVPLRGDDIDTDRIIPARHLRSVSFDGLDAHVFEDDRRAAARLRAPEARVDGTSPLPADSVQVHPFDDERFAGASVLVVQSNFGCGSSREHAPQAIQRWGIDAIVGESFSDIFFGNAVAIGLPCVTALHGDVHALLALVEQHPATVVRVDLMARRCDAGTLGFAVDLPASARDAFVSGAWDTTGMLLERYHEVQAVAERLPYLRGFPER